MKAAITAGLALALAGSLYAMEAPKEEKDKVSYSLGADIGEKLKQTESDLNADYLAQGLRDAFVGKPVLSAEEIKSGLQTFQTNLMAKMESKEKEAAGKNKEASEKYLAENKKKEGVKTTESGLQYKIETEGKGAKPTAEDTVTVHYSGKLADGTEFDSSYKRGEPVSFPVNGVIPGWTEALKMMPVGSKWQLVIPPALAYGENAPPVIGPNQVLIFDVELLGIKNEKEAKEEKK